MISQDQKVGGWGAGSDLLHEYKAHNTDPLGSPTDPKATFKVLKEKEKAWFIFQDRAETMISILNLHEERCPEPKPHQD